MRFEEAAALVDKSRGGKKKVAGNTYMRRIDENTIAVKLHSTDVVLIHSDGTYTLNAGGYRTATTKARINAFSPAHVYQTKRVWYIATSEAELFQDNCRVDSAGQLLTPVK